VDRIRERVHTKSQVPKRDRTEIILLLDAIAFPAPALRVVVDRFRRTHGSWAQGRCFRSIWIAGPTTNLVHRLDSTIWLAK
jgi:hypothetical protein